MTQHFDFDKALSPSGRAGSDGERQYPDPVDQATY